MNAADSLPAGFNVAAYLVDRPVAEGRGARPAFRCEGRVLTCGDVRDQVGRAGNALRDLGVDMEDRVLIACLDSPEFIAAFYGAIEIGAVAVPVNTLLRADDYVYFLEDSRAKVAVVSAPLLPEIGPALARAKALRHVLVAGGGAGEGGAGGAGPGLLSFEERLARASPVLEPAPTSRDDAAFWLYSSGSTGAPKGAVHLHHDMVVCLETYAKQVLGLRADDRVFSAAKLFFAYGLGNSGYCPLGVGAEAVLHPARITPKGAFDTIERERPTLFFGVPTLYAAMLAHDDPARGERRRDLSSLRLCVSAGESLPAEIYRRWLERYGVEILDGIGTTEVLHIFISNRPGAVRPGSSGTVVPGYEAEVVDEAGGPLPPGEVGNLRVRGDSTMAFYWNRHEKTKATLFGPWIRTGDKFTRDEDGFFWYCGRADDMLKVCGLWVSPVEVEAALVQHPSVLEAAVVGAEDDDRLVKPKAFVVLKETATASAALAEELRGFVKARLASYKHPRWVEFVRELPKTATGKIQRFKLRGPGPL